MIVAASSCSEDGLFSKDSKVSIIVKSIDLSGARGLMVMKAPGGAATKADEQQEYVDGLFKVDGNGNVSVAVFTFESEGLKKDKKWEEAECVLQLVPSHMEVLDNGYILLENVYPSPQELFNNQEKNVRRALGPVLDAWSYLLRPSEGALIPLNLYIETKMGLKGESSLYSSSSPDGSCLLFGVWMGGMNAAVSLDDGSITGYTISSAIVTDKGDNIEVRYSADDTFLRLTSEKTGYFTKDGRIVYYDCRRMPADNGLWLFDARLAPTFHDFAPDAKSVIDGMKSINKSFVGMTDFDRELYVLVPTYERVEYEWGGWDVGKLDSVILYRCSFENG